MRQRGGEGWVATVLILSKTADAAAADAAANQTHLWWYPLGYNTNPHPTFHPRLLSRSLDPLLPTLLLLRLRAATFYHPLSPSLSFSLRSWSLRLSVHYQTCMYMYVSCNPRVHTDCQIRCLAMLLRRAVLSAPCQSPGHDTSIVRGRSRTDSQAILTSLA